MRYPMQYEQLKQQLLSKQYTWLITGVAGFIGSNLLEQLLRLNQRVIGLDNFSTGYQQNLDQVSALVSRSQWQNFIFYEGDICSEQDCAKAITDVDFVLHQAALGSVPRSIETPLLTHASNLTGFLNMLTAAKNAQLKRVVYASSSAVYGDHPTLPKVEAEVGNALSPYAVTKYTNELYAKVFAHCYGVEAIGLRYFNVFGPRQDPNGAYAAVIPKWLGCALNSEPVYINGDGETSRDFTYIDNVVQANLLAALTKNVSAVNQVYNIALNERTTLNQLFSEMKTILVAFDSRFAEMTPIYRDFRQGDIQHSLADISRAQHLLAYHSDVSINQGLLKTVQWYLASIKESIA